MESKGLFSIWNQHKGLSKLFLLYLNVMGLRPLEFFLFQRGDRLYTSESNVYTRQILTYKDRPRAEMVIITALPCKAKRQLLSIGFAQQIKWISYRQSVTVLILTQPGPSRQSITVFNLT